MAGAGERKRLHLFTHANLAAAKGERPDRELALRQVDGPAGERRAKGTGVDCDDALRTAPESGTVRMAGKDEPGPGSVPPAVFGGQVRGLAPGS